MLKFLEKKSSSNKRKLSELDNDNVNGSSAAPSTASSTAPSNMDIDSNITIPNSDNNNESNNNSNSNVYDDDNRPLKKVKKTYNTSKPNGKAKYTPKQSKSQQLAKLAAKYSFISIAFIYLPKKDCIQCKWCKNELWTGDTHGLSQIQQHCKKTSHQQKQKEEEEKNQDQTEIVHQFANISNSRFTLLKPLFVMALLILVCQLPLFIIVSLMNALDFLKVKSTQTQYTAGQQRNEVFKAIGDVCANKAHEKIRNSLSVGVCIDEGTDVSEEKTLMVYCRIFNYETGEWEEVFAGALNLNGDFSAKNIAMTLIEFLLNIVCVCIVQVTGFASDGASVMIGNIGGVWVYFKAVFIYAVQFHCICHRGDLAVGKILLLIPELIILNDIIAQIYLYFSRSKNKHLLKDKATTFETRIVSIKKKNDTRWVGDYWSIRAIITDLVLLIDIVKEVKCKCEEAEYIYYELTDIQNIALLHYVGDIHSIMAQSFTLLQKEFVYVGSLTDHAKTLQLRIDTTSTWRTKGWYLTNFMDSVERNVFSKYNISMAKFNQARIDSLQGIMDKTCIKLTNNIKRRFKNSDLVDATRVFMPTFWTPFVGREDQAPDFGNEQFGLLLDKWGDLIDKKMAKVEFDFIRQELIVAASKKLKFLEFWVPIWQRNYNTKIESDLSAVEYGNTINNDNNDNNNNSDDGLIDNLEHPNVAKLVSHASAVSHASVGPERGYATLNHIKSSKRNTLLLTTTNTCLHSALNGPNTFEEFDYQMAINIFENYKSKRGRYDLKNSQKINQHPIKPKPNSKTRIFRDKEADQQLHNSLHYQYSLDYVKLDMQTPENEIQNEIKILRNSRRKKWNGKYTSIITNENKNSSDSNNNSNTSGSDWEKTNNIKNNMSIQNDNGNNNDNAGDNRDIDIDINTTEDKKDEDSEEADMNVDDVDLYPMYRSKVKFIQSDINLIRIRKIDWEKPKRKRKQKKRIRKKNISKRKTKKKEKKGKSEIFIDESSSDSGSDNGNENENSESDETSGDEEPVEKCAVCRLPVENDNSDHAQCDKCKQWHHIQCIHCDAKRLLTRRMRSSRTVFVCKKCSHDQKYHVNYVIPRGIDAL